MSIECTECEREGFTSERAMKIHRTKAHRESGRKMYQCATCGEEFEDDVYEDRQYCCRSCAYSDRQKDSNPQWKEKDPRVCEMCGEKFYVPPSTVEEGSGKYCSHECFCEWRKETGAIRGENHPRWKGGDYPHSAIPLTEEDREAVLERDEYECVTCGMTDEEHYEQYSQGLHVHHLKPRRHFLQVYDSLEEAREHANAKSNLMTLCSKHHGRAENRVIEVNV